MKAFLREHGFGLAQLAVGALLLGSFTFASISILNDPGAPLAVASEENQPVMSSMAALPPSSVKAKAKRIKRMPKLIVDPLPADLKPLESASKADKP